jgi:hypothetical protein
VLVNPLTAIRGKDSAREIREYFIPKFSLWRTDYAVYSQAFERLLKDLRIRKSSRSLNTPAFCFLFEKKARPSYLQERQNSRRRFQACDASGCRATTGYTQAIR